MNILKIIIGATVTYTVLIFLGIICILSSCMSIKTEIAAAKHRKRTKNQTEWLSTEGKRRMTEKKAHRTSKYVRLKPARRNNRGLMVKDK